jgi:hypothetical protein
MKKFVLILAATTLSLTLSLSAFAATPTVTDPGQALEIAPPVINLKADPGQSITTQVSIRDISTEKLLVTGQVNDFTAAGEDGTPKLLLEENETNPYSLRSWISPLPELLLEPKKVETMAVTVNVPANAAPGGYYGVVRFTARPPELKDTGVSLSASLGSLLFVRVSGDAKEALEIEEFSVAQSGNSGWLFESTPVNFIERLKNKGNTHLQPAGQITITDMFGQKVATVNVNLPPRNILPQSTRKFEQSLDSSVIGNKMLFGRYDAELRITYGDKQQVITSTLTFWIVPWRLIAIVIAVLIGGFFLIRFLIKRYNQRIISRAQGGGGLNIRSRRR